MLLQVSHQKGDRLQLLPAVSKKGNKKMNLRGPLKKKCPKKWKKSKRVGISAGYQKVHNSKWALFEMKGRGLAFSGFTQM